MTSRGLLGCVLWSLVGLLAFVLGAIAALLYAGAHAEAWAEAEL